MLVLTRGKLSRPLLGADIESLMDAWLERQEGGTPDNKVSSLRHCIPDSRPRPAHRNCPLTTFMKSF